MKGSEGSAAVKIKVMDVSWSELARDFDRAIDFDQSQLFRKIYEKRVRVAGRRAVRGADRRLRDPPAARSRAPRITIWTSSKSIAGVAAAAFCPFFANASPGMFDLGDDFVGLQRTFDHAHTLKRAAKWQKPARARGCPVRRAGHAARAHEAALHRRQPARRRILLRRRTWPVQLTRNYLWGGAAFALGAVILRAFENSAWPADIRGVQRGVEGGGLVTGLLSRRARHGQSGRGAQIHARTW